jgi:septal ring factor EnvC (AmiA/AmiB activator)
MTDKQKAMLNALSPALSFLLFGFFLFVSREFIQSVRADQAVHAAQIRHLEQLVAEKSMQLQFIESQMHELKETLRRIELKIDEMHK